MNIDQAFIELVWWYKISVIVSTIAVITTVVTLIGQYRLSKAALRDLR